MKTGVVSSQATWAGDMTGSTTATSIDDGADFSEFHISHTFYITSEILPGDLNRRHDWLYRRRYARNYLVYLGQESQDCGAEEDAGKSDSAICNVSLP